MKDFGDFRSAPTEPPKAIDSAPERNWRLGRARRADPMRVPRSTRNAPYDGQSKASISEAAVPETSTWAMMARGLAGLAFAYRRARKVAMIG